MYKDKITSQVYNDPLGFGSNHNTLKDARKLDPTITFEEIKNWKQDDIERTTQLKGYSSFVANKPCEEYQVDLCFHE